MKVVGRIDSRNFKRDRKQDESKPEDCATILQLLWPESTYVAAMFLFVLVAPGDNFYTAFCIGTSD